MTGVDIPINQNSLLSAHWRHHFRKVFCHLEQMIHLPIGNTTF